MVFNAAWKPLLARSTRQVALTEAGEMFYRRVRGVLDELRNARLEVSEFAAAPVGNLKISLPLTFGRRWIIPQLSAFLSGYPGVHLDVRFTDRLGPREINAPEALLQAALDGVGIALVPDWLITTEITPGQLVRILPEWKGQDQGGVYGIMPPGRLIPAKTRLFIDYLLREIGDK